MTSDKEHFLAISNCPTEELARAIARALVEEKLAACVNYLPRMRSIYHWQGKIQEDDEFLLMIKTMHSKLERLEAKIKEMHPYELPEFVVVPITSGSEDYLSWITQSLQ